jgi:nicotinamidase-related amidase
MRTEAFITPENIDGKLSGWLAGIAAYTNPRPHLVLDPSRCVLLVVDMLKYFAHPEGRVYIPSTRAIVPRIDRLLRGWRQTGGTVVFTRHCHRGPEDLGMLGRFFSDYIRCGERDSEIIEELTPLPSERVFRKNTYDAFHGTGLDEYLSVNGVDQVLVTGVLTQMCCETTARSAFVRGYEVYIPADALTTSTEELHVGSLRGLATGFAVITSTEVLCRE